jgi:ferredoxin-NADP reductase
MVKKYPSRIVSVASPLEGVHLVTIESLGREYNYLPGQFLHLALDQYDPSAAWPESRCFSMQTASVDKVIRLTYAVKGAFTRRMAEELVPGREIVVKLPYGELFSKGHVQNKCVFIAGGTGVTPFLSLFAHPDFTGYRKPVLWLGVREQRFQIYTQELEEAQRRNQEFLVHIVQQDTAGILDIQAIFQSHGVDATYFVSGPPAMIRTFKEFLIAHGVAQDQVRTDDWE